jgi:hypothetical protein
VQNNNTEPEQGNRIMKFFKKDADNIKLLSKMTNKPL